MHGTTGTSDAILIEEGCTGSDCQVGKNAMNMSDIQSSSVDAARCRCTVCVLGGFGGRLGLSGSFHCGGSGSLGGGSGSFGGSDSGGLGGGDDRSLGGSNDNNRR